MPGNMPLAFSFYLIFDLMVLELASPWNWRRRDCCVRQVLLLFFLLLLSYIKKLSNSWLPLNAQVSVWFCLMGHQGVPQCNDHHTGRYWKDGLGCCQGQLVQQVALFFTTAEKPALHIYLFAPIIPLKGSPCGDFGIFFWMISSWTTLNPFSHQTTIHKTS